MLGGLVVRQRSRDIRRFRTQKTASLLAYLAFYKRRSHSRDVLVEMFWPDSTLEAARSNLSVAPSALRRQLEGPGITSGAILVADHSQVHLNPDAYTSDVEESDQLVHDAQLETDADKRIALQIAALELYHGELLPGFYEDWVLAERDRLRDAYVSTLGRVVKGLGESREYEQAIEFSHRMLQADPLREDAYNNLMRLYLAVGRPIDALNQYKALASILQKELQTIPSAPLRDLAEKLRLAAPSQRQSIDPREPESHPSEAAPHTRRTSPGAQKSTVRLPFQFTRFFSREVEMARLAELLETKTRLITLTGPGGTGKTRLSVEVAWRAREEFPGGVWFVPLAELIDPLRVGGALRDVLELPRQSQSPALDQVIDFLNDRVNACLLILDNFEQIAAGGAPVVWTLLNRVPLLQCLVNSRQPLSLPGELEIPVLPLPTPAMDAPASSQALLPAQLLAYPSVALFVDRAQSVRSEFQITPRNTEAIAAICEKLEGIPLAIEPAAARARVLTPSQMLERLAKRFELLASRHADEGERHRSLWAAIDWSYHLLRPPCSGCSHV